MVGAALEGLRPNGAAGPLVGGGVLQGGGVQAHGIDAAVPGYCVRCIIRNCEIIKTNQSGFCYECPKYPCRRLKELDRRYRTKYGMSMIENLGFIREQGLSAFVDKEAERWRCHKCGGVICVHRGYCFACGEKPDGPKGSEGALGGDSGPSGASA